MLVRLQNSFAGAINKNVSLPKYILVVLEDDIITYLNYDGEGATQLFGDWITWLIEVSDTAISTRKEQLPIKAKRENEPCVYFTLAPRHHNFAMQRNQVRDKFNFALETTLKAKKSPHMRVIKLKNYWTFDDKSLVTQDKITEHGLYRYWEAVDSAFGFNAQHHELYLAKVACNSRPTANPANGYTDKANKNSTMCVSNNEVRHEDNRRFVLRDNEVSREDFHRERQHDRMHDFFKRHRYDHNTHNGTRFNNFNNFMLPRPGRR